MTFKHRRRVNNDMPSSTNTTKPMFLSSVRQKCTYGNIAESGLFCARVAILFTGARIQYNGMANFEREMCK